MAKTRIPWGQEHRGGTMEELFGDEWRNSPWACPDCAVAPGKLHQPGCDAEECPQCGDQALVCGHLESDGISRIDKANGGKVGAIQTQAEQWPDRVAENRTASEADWEEVAVENLKPQDMAMVGNSFGRVKRIQRHPDNPKNLMVHFYGGGKPRVVGPGSMAMRNLRGLGNYPE